MNKAIGKLQSMLDTMPKVLPRSCDALDAYVCDQVTEAIEEIKHLDLEARTLRQTALTLRHENDILKMQLARNVEALAKVVEAIGEVQE